MYAGIVWILGVAVQHILKRDALGFGDVKFFAVAGLWLGAGMLPVFLILSGILGCAFGIFWKKIKQKDIFPFGPALILALYAGILLSAANLGFLRF